jgi:hypothetical protein
MSKKNDDKIYVALASDRYGISYGLDNDEANYAVNNCIINISGEIEKPVKVTVWLASPDWQLEPGSIVASELTKVCEVEIPADKANALVNAHGDIETLVMIAEENQEPEVVA